MSETLLEIKDLHVKYQTDDETVHAINGISFSIKKGKTLGIVGETGAGKTTTALSIMKLLPQKVGKICSGSIVFDGVDIIAAEEAPMRSIRGEKISMIFQDPMTSLNPVITIGDQIGEALELHRDLTKAEISLKVNEILEMVGIPSGRKSEYPHQFSGGMKQRVVIAIALACEPELLIADEPTTALDVTIQAQVLDLMDKLKEQLNTSMLLITHDLGIVSQTCDDVAIMYAGEIIEIGSAEEIFLSDRHHPYTTGLFLSIPKIDDKSKRLQPIDGLMPDPTILWKGCSFNDRCPKRTSRCEIERPSDHIEGTHIVKCHLFDKLDKGVE